MDKGLATFRMHFAGYEEQYVLIGGAACDVLFESSNANFRATNGGIPQFYRFDKPEDDAYPKMIELFCRNDLKLKKANGLTPVHIDDEISSLSAILLDDEYYSVLRNGKVVKEGLSVLRPEYIILFKAKAYLDLRRRKEGGGDVDSSSIKKHKKDILRIAAELMLEKVSNLPVSVKADIDRFMSSLKEEPFDRNLLKEYGLKNDEIVRSLNRIFE